MSSSPPVVLRRRRPNCPTSLAETPSLAGEAVDAEAGWSDDALPALRQNCKARRSWFGGNGVSSGADDSAHLFSTLSSVSSITSSSTTASSRLSFIADKLSMTSLSRRHHNHHHTPLASSLSCSSTASTSASAGTASGGISCGVCGAAAAGGKNAEKNCGVCLSHNQQHVNADRALSTVATVIKGVGEAITADSHLCDQLKSFITSSNTSPSTLPSVPSSLSHSKSSTTSQSSPTPTAAEAERAAEAEAEASAVTADSSPQHTDETVAPSISVVCCRCCAVPRLHSAEARLALLQRHLLELQRISEACQRQKRMLAGAERLTAAFTLAGGQKHQGLSQSRASLRQCSDTMNSLYSDLEANLGAIRIEVDELLGFARLCAGDVYDVVVRMSSDTVWRTRVTIGNSSTGSGSASSWWYVGESAPLNSSQQSWTARYCWLKPALHHRMVVKLREVRGLTRKLAGTGLVDTAELFRLNTQRLILCLNPAGTLRLCMKVTWSPLGDGFSDRQYTASHHGCSCVSAPAGSTPSPAATLTTGTTAGADSRWSTSESAAGAETMQWPLQSVDMSATDTERARDSVTASLLSSVSTQLGTSGAADDDQTSHLVSGTMASYSSGDSSSNRSPRDSSISSIDSCHKLSQYWLLQQNHHLGQNRSVSLSPCVSRPSVLDHNAAECNFTAPHGSGDDVMDEGLSLSAAPSAAPAVELDGNWPLRVRVAWSCSRLHALISAYVKQQEIVCVGARDNTGTTAVNTKETQETVSQCVSGGLSLADGNVSTLIRDLRTLLDLIGVVADRAPSVPFSSSVSAPASLPYDGLASSVAEPLVSSADVVDGGGSSSSVLEANDVFLPNSQKDQKVTDPDAKHEENTQPDQPDQNNSERSDFSSKLDGNTTANQEDLDEGRTCEDVQFGRKNGEDETEEEEEYLEQQSQSSDASVESALDKFNFLLAHTKDDTDVTITTGTNDSGIASIIHNLDEHKSTSGVVSTPTTTTKSSDIVVDVDRQVVEPSSEKSDNYSVVGSTFSENVPVDVCLDVHLLSCVRLAQRLKFTGPLRAVSSLSASKLCRQYHILEQLVIQPAEIKAEQLLTDRQLLQAWYNICGEKEGSDNSAPLYVSASIAVERLSLTLKPRLSHRDEGLANKVGRLLVSRCLGTEQITGKSLLTVFALNALFSGSTFDRVIEELAEEVEFSNCLLSHNAHSIGRRLSQVVYMVPPVHCMSHVCRLMTSTSASVTDTLVTWLRDLAGVSFVVQKLVPVFFELLESESSVERVGSLLVLHRLHQSISEATTADSKQSDEAVIADISWYDQLITAAQYLQATDSDETVRATASTILQSTVAVPQSQ